LVALVITKKNKGKSGVPMYRGVWGVKDVKENSGTKNNITEK